jgi:hypothetical protein
MAGETDKQRWRKVLEDEAEKWRREGELAEERLFHLGPDHSERAEVQAWLDHCFRKREEIVLEIDKLLNPQKHAPADVLHLDDYRDR